jgi:uncharacterized protein
MSNTLKSIVAAAIGVAVLAIATAAVIYAVYYGRSVQPSSYRTFSVSADGKAVTIPDVAQFSFTTITEGGKDLAALQKQNTEAVNNAIDYVKGQGVAAKDVKTISYYVNPRYENYSCYDAPIGVDEKAVAPMVSGSGSSGASAVAPQAARTTKVCPPPAIVGYTVTQSVETKIRDFSKVGDIMSGVVTNGANQVGSLNFTMDDPTSAQDTARNEAMAKARTKAEGMARAGGFGLGRLLSIQEGRGSYPMYEKSYAMDSAAYGTGGLAAPAPSIEPGSQETNVTVTMTFEIR